MEARVEPFELAQRLLCLRGDPFDLVPYPYLRAIYNTNCREVGLFTARQISKSTSLASKLVLNAVMAPQSVSMFVAPLQDQTEVFSMQRLRDFILESPIVKEGFFTGRAVVDQVFRKQFTNGSMISLGYAQRTADRLRGRSIVGGIGRNAGAYLCFDEIQDILPDVVPIIKETTFRTTNPLFWYCGTPKTFSNHMEAMRARGTGAEWAARCTNTGCKKWNLNWTDKNIGNTGVICEFCGGPLNTDLGEWVVARNLDYEKGRDARVTMETYRIPQLIVRPIMSDPFKWRDLLGKHREYSSAQFANEVLGLPYDSGSQPVNLAQLSACCEPNRPNVVPDTRKAHLPPLCMGVDWAFVGEDSYTFVTIGGFNPFPSKFELYYYRIFKGSETDVEFQEKTIIELANRCNIQLIGADWGAGHVQNIHLTNALGEHRVAQMWHTGMGMGARKTPRAKWEPKTRKWHLARTAVLTDTFESVRRGQITFPRSEDCGEFFDHMLAVMMEYDERTNTSRYVHIKPDDGAHSLTFCMLASELACNGDFRGHVGMADQVNASAQADTPDDGWGVGNDYYN